MEVTKHARHGQIGNLGLLCLSAASFVKSVVKLVGVLVELFGTIHQEVEPTVATVTVHEGRNECGHVFTVCICGTLLVGGHLGNSASANGRFLRHRFSPKPRNVATENSLPKRNHVAKEAVSAAWQTSRRQRSEPILQTKRSSKDEAAALRKNHVSRRLPPRRYKT